MIGPSAGIRNLPGRAVRAAFGGGLALALGATAPAAAQVAVIGVILEQSTRQPIQNVELRLLDDRDATIATALTNARGEFRLEAPVSGEYFISIRRLGYAPMRTRSLALAQREEMDLEITLNPTAVALDELTVVVERPAAPWLREVRRRTELNRRMGIGRIFVREDLERIRPNSVAELLNAQTFTMGCSPTVLLDGLETQAGDIPYHPDIIEAIEIYRGPNQVPPEFTRYSSCGVALVWTRSDPPGARPLTWRRVIAAGVLVGVAALLVR